MFKFLAIALCIVLVAATDVDAVTPSEVDQIVQGLNDALNVTSDATLDNCADVPLAKDVHALAVLLNSSNPNPFALVSAVLALYNDYKGVKANCPEVAQVYEQYFGTFTSSVKSEPSKTLLKVAENLLTHLTQVNQDADTLLQDFGAGDFYNVGAEFGDILALGLEGYIQN